MKKAIAILVTLAVAGMGLFLTLSNNLYMFSGAVADCATIEATANEMLAIGDEATYHNRMQEVRACYGEDLDKSKLHEGEVKENDTPQNEADSPADTPSATPTVEPPATPQPRSWEFLANRPAVEKNAINSYGPIQGLKVDKRLDDKSVTMDEALSELRYRMSIDPMLTAATGAALELWSYDVVDEKSKLFSEDFAKWDEANAEVNRKIDEAIASGNVKIEELNGVYTATYSIPGETPAVRTGANVPRNGELALVINGHKLQILCGFQEYSQAPVKAAKEMPKPSPGMTRTPEGTPVKIVEKPKPKPTPSKPVPPTKTPPPTVPPTKTPPPTVPPTKTPPPKPTPKPSKGTSTVEPGAPPAKQTGKPRPSAAPVTTKKPGGGGVTDTPTNKPSSETGVTAPGASSAPTTKHTEPPATGGNSGGGNSCVPALGKTTC